MIVVIINNDHNDYHDNDHDLRTDFRSMAKCSARFVFSLCSDHLYFVIIIVTTTTTIIIVIIAITTIIITTLALASLAASASAAIALISCSGTRTSFTWLLLWSPCHCDEINIWSSFGHLWSWIKMNFHSDMILICCDQILIWSDMNFHSLQLVQPLLPSRESLQPTDSEN